jgi:L-serine deaminase
MRRWDTKLDIGLIGLLAGGLDMLKARLNAARSVATALLPAEADLEAAIASTANLVGTIVGARREAGVAISVAQDALAELGDTLQGLIRARGTMASAHAALAGNRIELGLRAHAMGDVSDCPPASASLSLVTDERAVA